MTEANNTTPPTDRELSVDERLIKITVGQEERHEKLRVEHVAYMQKRQRTLKLIFWWKILSILLILIGVSLIYYSYYQ